MTVADDSGCSGCRIVLTVGMRMVEETGFASTEDNEGFLAEFGLELDHSFDESNVSIVEIVDMVQEAGGSRVTAVSAVPVVSEPEPLEIWRWSMLAACVAVFASTSIY